MGNSLRLGRIAGIPLYAHVSLLIALPFLAFLFAEQFVAVTRYLGIPRETIRADPYVWGIGIAITLFLSVLLHELAHSLYARSRGTRVAGITLMLIGGVSQMEEMPARARDEAIMAALGPVTSLALGGVLFGLGLAIPREHWELRFAFASVAHLNLILGAFNLLPAFPMDGGRILRAALASRRGVTRATETAAQLGKGFALLFGVLGLFTMNFLLILVAWFVWAGARAEAQHAEMKEALASRRVADLLVPAPTVVDAKAPLSEAANALLVAHRSALPIVRDGRYAGMLLADDLPGHDEHTPVAEALRRTRPVRIDEPAWNALQAMETAGLPEIAVVDDEGAIAGMITREDAVRLLRLERLKAKSRLLDSSHPSTT